MPRLEIVWVTVRYKNNSRPARRLRGAPVIVSKILLLSLLAASCLVGSARADYRIAILVSDSLKSTNRTVSGAKSVIKQHHVGTEYRQFLLRSAPIELLAQLDSIRSYSPRIILAVGSAATNLAKREFSETPTVFAAVLYPVLSGFVKSMSNPGSMITGASLNLPVETQFRYFRQIVPNLEQIGVIYTENTAPLVRQAERIAVDMGIRLKAVRVEHERDLPLAIDSLRGKIQGLWSLADPTLFTPQGTKYILLNLLKAGIPVMGFSRHVVESGALFGLDFDYKAVGRQSGRIVAQIIDGTSPSRIAVARPDIIWFHYNENTAQYLKIEIPPELMAVAREVYR